MGGTAQIDNWCAVGLSRAHLSHIPDIGLAMAEAGHALARLSSRARASGFELAVASGYRDYFRQLAIFNAKARGERQVTDDAGLILAPDGMSSEQWLHAILRFSALPGASRHHWGTDFDVWDQASVSSNYSLRLEPAEYDLGGPFAAFSEWLTELIEEDDAEGFYRPYATDMGGVAVEAWHLSYRPLASQMATQVTAEKLLSLWHCAAVDTPVALTEPLALVEEITPRVEALLARYGPA